MVVADPDESVQFAKFAAEIDLDDELPLTLELAADGNPDESAHVVIARLVEDE